MEALEERLIQRLSEMPFPSFGILVKGRSLHKSVHGCNKYSLSFGTQFIMFGRKFVLSNLNYFNSAFTINNKLFKSSKKI